MVFNEYFALGINYHVCLISMENGIVRTIVKDYRKQFNSNWHIVVEVGSNKTESSLILTDM